MRRDIYDEQYIDSTFLWYMFRRACGQNNNQAISPIKNGNDELINDIDGILNEWMVYNNKLLNSSKRAEEYIEFHDQVDKEVEKVYKEWTSDIENLKNIGYDGIDTEHIKLGGKMLVMIITKLFNRAIEPAIFPKDFKFELLIPIPKPGKSDYTNKNNCRGITLRTTIGKYI